MVYAAVGFLVDIEVADTHVFLMCFLHAIQVERGVASHVSLYHLSGKEIAVVGSVVAEEEFYLRSFLHYDEHTAVYHEVNV